MGPITLFDKSFLQSLNLDESVWFDYFFYSVITPLFYVETLSDLEKNVRLGRTPEKEVGIIADKTPEIHGGPCLHHNKLVIANLMGEAVPMNGRIPTAYGRPVKHEGRRGIVIETTPEAEAFKRWKEGDFLEVERKFAHKWRSSLNSLDLPGISSAMKIFGFDSKNCKSLKEVKQLADLIVKNVNKSPDYMKFAFLFLGVSPKQEFEILKKWEIQNRPDFSIFAPYAAYVLTVELFFHIALVAKLISTERNSNRTDIAYLFYLPFGMIFVSSDKLHRRCSPFFLREDQSFVWGEDLKIHLSHLNDHYSKLPETEKEKGIFHIARTPPDTEGCLVSQLWDRHLRSWRNNALNEKVNSEERRALIEDLNKFSKAPTVSPDMSFDSDEADVLTIERSVRRKKGSWWQINKNFK